MRYSRVGLYDIVKGLYINKRDSDEPDGIDWGTILMIIILIIIGILFVIGKIITMLNHGKV